MRLPAVSAPRPSLLLFVCGALAPSLTACATSLPLDPAFALHAEELSAKSRAGFWPNAPVEIGDSSFDGVSLRRRDAGVLELPGATVRFGHDSFRLSFLRHDHAILRNRVECEGGITADDTSVEVVRCRSEGGGAEPSTDEPPAGRFVLDVASRGRGGLHTGTVTDLDGKAIWSLEEATIPEGKATSGNVSGYVLKRGDVIEGTFDITYRGSPRAWVARELTADARAAMAGVFASVYFLGGKADSR